MNMIHLREIDTSSEHYAFMEKLMETAFPQQERRDNVEQRANADHNPLFHSSLILDEDQPIGLLNYWEFGTFRYIEHFAIDDRLRGHGYGKETMNRLKEDSRLPIVLEVEEPTDNFSQRRIAFYQRLGFILHPQAYLQPPYRVGDTWFPLLLMSYGDINMEKDFESIRNTIYREVYRVQR